MTALRIRPRACFFFLALGILALLPNAVFAATTTVTTLVDNDVNDAECSLREALLGAALNNDRFGCVRTGGGNDDLITFDGGLWTGDFATMNLTIQLGVIGGDKIEIVPPAGKTLNIHGDGTTPVFVLDQAEGAEFHLTRIWVQDGFSTANGGGIRILGGTSLLKVTDGRFLANHADSDGGGIGLETDDRITIELDGIRFSDNSAGLNGGGIGGRLPDIYQFPGTEFILTGDNSIMEFNMAGVDGGAIHIRSRQITTGNAEAHIALNGFRFSNNESGRNGGAVNLVVDSGAHRTRMDFVIDDSVFLANESLGAGGAVAVTMGSGGGTSNLDGTLRGNRFESNNAGGAGGALYMNGSNTRDSGPILVEQNAFITNSTAAEFSGGGAVYWSTINGWMVNNLLSENSATFSGGGLFISGFGDELALRLRHVWANTFFRNSAGDQTTDPAGWNLHFNGADPLLNTVVDFEANSFTTSDAGGGIPAGDEDCLFTSGAIFSAHYNVAATQGCTFNGISNTNRISFVPQVTVAAITHPVHTVAAIPEPGGPLIDYWPDDRCELPDGTPLLRHMTGFRRVAGVPIDGDGVPPADCDTGSFEAPEFVEQPIFINNFEDM